MPHGVAAAYASEMADPQTRDLVAAQLEREAAERERAGNAVEDAEERAHERRADRAAYLREKLAERAASEDEVRREERG